MKKKCLAAILALSMSISLMACGSASDNTEDTAKESEAQAQTEEKEDSSVAESEEDSTEESAKEDSTEASDNKVTKTEYGTYTADEPYQLEFAYPSIYQQDESALQAVEDAMNEYMEENYQIHVTFHPLQWATMMTDLQMMITGGDKLDILPMPYQNANGFIAMDGLEDISSYLSDTEEGKKIVDTIGESTAYAGNVNGIIYGLPAMKEVIVLGGLCMRADICDELGLTEKYGLGDSDEYTGTHLDWDEVTEIFKTVKEAHPEMNVIYYAASQGPEQLQELVKYDTLMDRFGVLNWEEDHDSITVVNMFETDSFKKAITQLAEWYDAGYINQDAATAQEVPTNMIRAGNTFCYMSGIKPGFLSESEANNGQKMYAIYVNNFTEGILISNNVNYMNTCIASTSEDPEMAFKFLSTLYTDPEVMNYWQYGIKDVNYQILDDGTAYYVDGEDASNYKYHQGTGWAMGNQFLTYVWNDGTKTADYWEQLQKHNEWGLESPAYGFMWDASDYTTELAALNGVLDTYYNALTTGSVGVSKVDSTIEEFNKALYSAGLQDVIDEKQAQLDKWLEDNGGPAQTPQENIDLINSVK